VIFLSPEHLYRLDEEGCVRSRLSCIGCDRDYENEILEELGLSPDDSGEVDPAAPAAPEPDPFHDWVGSSSESVVDYDDPHENLLRRIGALKRGGKR
jgi:hypothetical protein